MFEKKLYRPSVAMPNISFKVLISEIHSHASYILQRECTLLYDLFSLFGTFMML